MNQSSRLHRDQSSPSNKQLKGQETCGVGGHEHAVLEENPGERAMGSGRPQRVAGLTWAGRAEPVSWSVTCPGRGGAA